MWTFILACVTPDSPSDPEADVVLLDLDVRERSRIGVNDASVRLTPDGPGLPDPGWVAVGTSLVVVDPGDPVRFRVTDSRATLLLWADRADLALVAAVPTTARATPEMQVSEASVQIEAGTIVNATEDAPGATRVEVDTTGLLVDAWVSAGDVDEVYESQGDDKPARWPGGFRFLEPGAVLRDAPGGNPMASVPDIDQGGFVRDGVELRWEGDAVLVRVHDGGVVVTGWVDRSERTQVGQGYGSSWGCGCCGGISQPIGPVVPAGALLWSAPQGQLVGRAEAELAARPGEGGWLTEIWTPFGVVTAWVPEAVDYGPAIHP